jgi:hypothetical protein
MRPPSSNDEQPGKAQRLPFVLGLRNPLLGLLQKGIDVDTAQPPPNVSGQVARRHTDISAPLELYHFLLVVALY